MATETGTEVIGWISSGILLLTLGRQLKKQWQENSSEGVSKWLWVGQIAASLGFTIYSYLVRNWIFVATNGLLLLYGFAGIFMVLRHRRRRANSA